MREFAVAIVLIAGLAAGVAWWSTRNGAVYTGRTPEAAASVPPAPPKPVRPSVAPRAPKRAPVDAPQKPIELPAPEIAARLETPPPPVEPPPFPTIDQIESGAEAHQIVDLYGEPTLSATTSNRKHIVETFVYARDRGQTQTLIQLEDGIVASAYSRSMPAPVMVLTPGPRVRH